MGQNDAMRPHDVSNIFGPLWCIPIAAGLAAVWSDLPAGLDIIGVEGPAGVSASLERHKVFSARISKIFYTLSSHGFQDGQTIRVVLGDQSGGQTEAALPLRLANWHVDGTPQIVSSIISRILPSLGPIDPTPLERFLSLVSSWRATCRLSAEIGTQSAYAIDVDFKFFSDKQICFFVTDYGLSRNATAAFALGEGTAIVTAQGQPHRAYADLGDELVELDFSHRPISAEQSLSWLHMLDGPARQRLVDTLSDVAVRDQVSFPAYIASSLKSPSLPLAEACASLTVHGAYQANRDLFAFVEVAGSETISDLGLELFGASGTKLTIETRSHTFAADPGASKTRYLVRARLPGTDNPIACKIQTLIGDQQVSTWVQIQIGSTAASFTLARTFLPVGEYESDYQLNVVLPFSEQRATLSNLGPRISSGPISEQMRNQISLQILADDDLNALQHTLIALRSSTGAEQPVRVILSAGANAAADYRKVQEWFKRLRLTGTIDLVPAGSPASASVRHGPGPVGFGFVTLRAGFIPPHSGWIEQIEKQLRASPDTVLVGINPDQPRSLPVSGSLLVDDLYTLLGTDGIVAVAATGSVAARVQPSSAVCQTLSGGWAEWLRDALQTCEGINYHPALGMWATDPPRNDDDYALRIDQLAYSRLLAWVERDDPRRQASSKNVANA